MSATPEREQAEALSTALKAEALSTALRTVGHAETFRRIFLDAVVTPPVMRTDALLVLDAAQTLAAAVSRLKAEQERRDAEGVEIDVALAALGDEERARVTAEVERDAAVERAEKAERVRDAWKRRRDEIYEWQTNSDATNSLLSALRAAEVRADAAVERERELTRALTQAQSLLSSERLRFTHEAKDALAIIAEALAGGVSAAGRPPEQDLGGNAVAVAEALRNERAKLIAAKVKPLIESGFLPPMWPWWTPLVDAIAERLAPRSCPAVPEVLPEETRP